MEKKTSFLTHSLSLSPWVCFLVFLITNTLLSFFPFSLQTQLFLLLFGLVLPFFVTFKTMGDPLTRATDSEKAFPLSFHWAFTLYFFLVILTRISHLNSLPPWPSSDEGYEGSLGISLLGHWDWRLLWSPIPHEPLLDWLLGIYFHSITPSLFSFRLFSALISLATVATAYWGARAFFSRRLSFLFTLILAFSYWGLVLSHLGVVVILIPLWQCWSFGCLGRLFKSPSPAGRWWAGAGLIAGNLLGFYSWTNWAGLALGLTLVLVLHVWKEPRVSKTYLWVYGLVLAAALAPLVLARLAPGGLTHWREVYHLNFLRSAFYYLVGFFWDGSASFPYGSLWGGFFNPLLDSLILLGILFFFQRADRGKRWVFPLVVFLSILPALLTSGDVELFRAAPLLVFLTLAAAAGVQSLLSVRGRWNVLAVVLILVISFGADTWNYNTRYCDTSFAPEKHLATMMVYAEAWRSLEGWQKESGPLDIFSAFTTDFNNRTLDIAIYPFNVLQNPALSTAQPRWAALMVHPDYLAYFQHAYPQSQFIFLKEYGGGSVALVMIPLQYIPPPTLERWKAADRLFREANLAWLKKNPSASWRDLAAPLTLMSETFKGDPFLRAVYGEKIGFLNYLDKNFDGAAQAYRDTLKAYPAPHVYYDISLCLKALGKNREADDSLRKAASFFKK